MIEVKDEILNGEPLYRIRDKNNNILFDNLTIEMVTEVLQKGTPINKALFDGMYEKIIPSFLHANYNKATYTLLETPQTVINYIPTLASNEDKGFKISGEKYSASDIKVEDFYKYFSSDFSTRIDASDKRMGTVVVECANLILIDNIKISGYVSGSTPYYVQCYASNDNLNWEYLGQVGFKDCSNQIYAVKEFKPSIKRYFKYLKFLPDSDSYGNVRVDKINVDGTFVNSLDIGRLDLNLDVTSEYQKGQKISFEIPDTYNSLFKTKFQLNGLGYKDIEIVGSKWNDVIFDGEKFISNGNYITGVYTGNGANQQFINLGFTPKAIYVSKQSRRKGNDYLIGSDAGLAITNYPSRNGNNTIIEIVDNGFNVFFSYSSYGYYEKDTNADGKIYMYIAFK